MSVTGAELQLVITGDDSGAIASINQTEAAVTGAAGNINNTFSQVLIGREVEKWGQSLLKFGQDFVNVGANFQQSIEFINRLTSATADGFDQLQNKALTLARTSIFSAQDIINGMEQLAREGFTVDQITEGGMRSLITAATDMATALGTDIPTAANTLGQVMRVFADQNLNGAQTADILTQAVLRSGQGITQFSNGLQYIAAGADLTQTSLQDISTVVSFLESQLIKGRNAGTSLRTMFIDLQDPASKAGLELQKLGIETLNADGTFRGFLPIVSDLHDKFKTLTEAQQSSEVNTIFGKYAYTAMLEVIKGGPGALAAFQAKEENLGSAHDIARVKMDNLAGSLHNFTSSLVDVQIVLGESIAGFIKPFIDLLNILLGIFIFLPAPVHFVIAAFVLLAGALLSIVGAIIMFNAVGGMVAVAQGIELITGILGPAIALLTEFAMPIIALAAAIYLLKKAYDDNFLGFATGVNAVFAGIGAVVNGVIAAITGVVHAIEWLIAPFQEAAKYAAALMAVFFIFGQAGYIWWFFLGPLITGALGAIAAAIGPVIAAIEFLLPILADLWLPFVLITAAIFALKAAWDNNFLGFADGVKALLGDMLIPFQPLIDAFSNLVDGVTTFKDVFEGTMANDPKNWGWGTLASTIDALGNAIKFVFGQSALTDWLNNTAIVVQNAIDLYQRLTDHGVNPLAAAFEAFGFVLSSLGLGGLGGFFVDLGHSLNDALTWFKALTDAGVSPFTASMEAMTLFLNDMGLPGLASLFNMLAYHDWGGVLKSIGQSFLDLGGWILDGILGIDWTGIAQTIWTGLVTAVQAAAQAGIDLPGVLLNVGLTAAGDLATWARDIWGWVEDQLGIGGSKGNKKTHTKHTDEIPIGDFLLSATLTAAGDLAKWADDIWGWVEDQLGISGSKGNKQKHIKHTDEIPIGEFLLSATLKAAGDLAKWTDDLWGWVEDQLGISGSPGNRRTHTKHTDEIPIGTFALGVLFTAGGDLLTWGSNLAGWVQKELFSGASLARNVASGAAAAVADIQIPSMTVGVTEWFLANVDQAWESLKKIVKGAVEGKTVDIAKLTLFVGFGALGLGGELLLFHTDSGAWLRAKMVGGAELIAKLGAVTLEATLGAFRWAGASLGTVVSGLLGWGTWIWAQVKGGWDQAVDMGSASMKAVLGAWNGGTTFASGMASWGAWIWTQVKGGWDQSVDMGSASMKAVLGAWNGGTTFASGMADWGKWIWTQVKGGWDQSVDMGSATMKAAIKDFDSGAIKVADWGVWLWDELKGAWTNVVNMGSVTMKAALSAFAWADAQVVGLGGSAISWGNWIWGQVKGGWDQTVKMGDATMQAAVGAWDGGTTFAAAAGAAGAGWGKWIWQQVGGNWDHKMDAGLVTISATISGLTTGIDFSGWATAVKNAAVAAIGAVTDFGSSIASAIGGVISTIKATDWTSFVTIDSFNFGQALGGALHDAVLNSLDWLSTFSASVGAALHNLDWSNVVDLANSAKDIFNAIMDGIATAIQDGAAVLSVIALAIVSGLLGFIVGLLFGPDAAQKFGDFLSGIVDNISLAVTATDWSTAGAAVVGAIWDAIKSKAASVFDWKSLILGTDNTPPPNKKVAGVNGTDNSGNPVVGPDTGNSVPITMRLNLQFLANGHTYSDLNSAISGSMGASSGPGGPHAPGGSGGFSLPAPDMTAFLAAFTTARTAAQTAIGSIIASVTNGLGGLGGLATTYGDQFRTGLSSGFSDALAAVQTTLSNIIVSTTNALSNLGPTATTAGSNLRAGLANGFAEALAAAQSALSDIVASTTNALSNLGPAASSAGNDFASGINDGFQSALADAQSAIGDLISSVVNGLGNFYGFALDAGASVGQGLADGMYGQVGAVYAAAYALSAAAASATTTFNKNASPSKLYREYGQMIGAGFALGMDDSQALVARSAAGMLAAPGGINRTSSGSTPIGIGGSTTINHITQTITVPAANFKEWLETVEFVQTLDTTRQMHFGAH